MTRDIQRFIPAFILWLLCGTLAQAQDFSITSFKENLLDLTAARAAVKDKNGDLCALIKISVRDDRFEYEPNLGVVRQEKKVGEVWLYVPQQTKRITIRHPQLGILRDYIIPVSIEQKMVYEAELQITNESYLSFLLQMSKTDTVRIMVPQEPTVLKVEAERSVFFNLGVGFNVVGVMGPTAFLGFDFVNHVIEAGAVIGMNKAEGISIYQVDNAAFWGTYDYKAMRFFARYGYNIEASSFIITPLAGVAINNISGDRVQQGAGDLFETMSTVSATVGCRFSYCLSKSIRVYATPEFGFTVKKDHSFDVVKEADSKVKSWSEGIGLSAGILFRF